MTQNVVANTVLFAALPELYQSWIPASVGTTRQIWHCTVVINLPVCSWFQSPLWCSHPGAGICRRAEGFRQIRVPINLLEDASQKVVLDMQSHL